MLTPEEVDGWERDFEERDFGTDEMKASFKQLCQQARQAITLQKERDALRAATKEFVSAIDAAKQHSETGKLTGWSPLMAAKYGNLKKLSQEV